MWMKWLSFLVALCVGIQGWPAEPQGGMALERGTESIGPTPPATHLVNITMPSIRPDKEDQYLCYGKKITEEEVYIVNFKALATASRTHHLLVYGCQQPQMLSDNAWPCHSICGPSETPRILYAWAKNADPTHMPDNVGFELGGETRLNYVVIQVHYKTPLEVGEPPDQSGVQLTLTSQRQQYIAGIFIFMRYQLQIPPHTKVVHGDMSCKYNGQTSLYPFAFRVHAHTLGRVITAYHFNNTWNLIGKGNPQWPQAFYPVVGKHEIKPGETMFGRCTYDSSERGRSTKIGGKHTDEMCNFYMMYYTDASRGDSYIQCINNQIQPLPAPIPADSDTPLPPNPELEDIAQGVHHYPGVQLVKDWPALGDRELGQVSAVATDSSGNVHIFHRGKRVWGQESFDQYNHFREPAVAIQEKTLITFNEDGQVIHEWGENIFYMPHGLHIDQQGNHWVTDVGLHQVFKFKPGSTKPLLTLGKRFEPGSDAQHFCKPTDVAVLSTGEFFVADGYCNHRVMKFAANGQYLMEWGTRTSSVTEGSYPPPSAFDIPHSITALEDQKQVCVADRENGRIQCFHYNGTFTRQIHPHEFHHRLFAVNYNPTHKLMFAVNGPDVYDQTTPVQGFVLDGQTDTLLEHFGANSLRFSNPHDVAADDVGSALYVAEIGPNKIWKFKISPEIIKGHSRPSSVDTETGSGDMGLSTMMSGDFQVSVVIGLLLVIPILIIVAITVVMRLKKNGKLKFLNRTKYNNRRFNLGDFFGSHKGFDRLATEDGDELEHLNSDSDVEEYSATTRKA